MVQQLPGLINFVLCAAIFWSCMCRLRLITRDTKESFRWLYIIVCNSAIASGLRGPLFGSVADWFDVISSAACLSLLLMSAHRWQGRAPEDSFKETQSAARPS